MHELIYREYHTEKSIQKTWLAPSLSEGGRLSCTYALAMDGRVSL